jgi:hypothetical protein
MSVTVIRIIQVDKTFLGEKLKTRQGIQRGDQGDDAGSTHLRNVSQLQRGYTGLHPRRL